MKIGFLSMPLTGHLHPMTALIDLIETVKLRQFLEREAPQLVTQRLIQAPDLSLSVDAKKLIHLGQSRW